MLKHLVRGGEYLSRFPTFRLIGRKDLQTKLMRILMRKKSNSVVLVGPSGVGVSTLALSLQAMKTDPNAPFDIVNKRFYWLDIDALFASGDSAKINAEFQKMMEHLSKTPHDILVITDTRSFIEASERTGNGHFANALTNAVKNDWMQVILEVRDGDLEYVLKYHNHIRDNYTLLDVHEPRAHDLEDIILGVSEEFTKYHGVKIDPDAISTAIDLTQHYTHDHLKEAQPGRALTVIDLALATYRLHAHENPPKLVALREKAQKDPSLIPELEREQAQWDATQKRLRQLYADIREGEIAIEKINDVIDSIREEEEKAKAAREARGEPEEVKPYEGSDAFLIIGGTDSPRIQAERKKIKEIEALVDESREAWTRLTNQINADLVLTRDSVVAEFASITGIDANKLNEKEEEVLRSLEPTLKNVIFGQDHVIQKVSNGIKVSKIGGRNEGRPLGCFMFLGPSGVGKTELGRQLARALGLEFTLFNMADFQEKHSVARLIGAPPGYDGFEAGGQLTNAARKNRKRLYLFDEIEKAHPQVFDVMLALLDNGHLVDSRGLDAFYEDAIVVMTTNLGQPHFLNPELTFEQATALAVQDVDNTYRPEFLNRFEGRENIIPFNKLDHASIQRIVKREMSKVASAYVRRGITSVIDDTSIEAFVHDRYDPVRGARGLPAVIRATLDPIIVNHILDNPGKAGEFTIRYDVLTKRFDPSFKEVV